MTQEITDKNAQEWILKKISKTNKASAEGIANARQWLAEDNFRLFLIDDNAVIIVEFGWRQMTVYWCGSWMPGLEVFAEYHPEIQALALSKLKEQKIEG
jgi:hypothetical protein